jgi:hypothetical protein
VNIPPSDIHWFSASELVTDKNTLLYRLRCVAGAPIKYRVNTRVRPHVALCDLLVPIWRLAGVEAPKTKTEMNVLAISAVVQSYTKSNRNSHFRGRG